MMPSEAYKILFSGQTLENVSLDVAKANLKKLLKANDETVERLFSGKSFAIKKDLEQSQVEKYISVLNRAGLDVKIAPPLPEQINPETVAPESASSPAVAKKPVAQTSETNPLPAAQTSKPVARKVLIIAAAAVVVFVVVVGVIAAIAIPQYQEYTVRAETILATETVAKTRDHVAHFILSKSTIPNSNREAGLLDDISGEQVSSIKILPGAVMRVTFESENSQLNGKTIVWVPEYDGNRVSWDCSGGTLSKAYRPDECREGKYLGEGAPSNLKQFVAADGSMEVIVPRSWKPEKLVEDATVQLANLITEAYLVIYTEPKITLPNHDLSSFGNAVRDAVSSALDKPNFQYLGSTSVNGKLALHYRIDGSIDGIDLVYLVTVVEGKDNFYQVITWSLASRFTGNAGDLKNVIASFKERKSG